MTAVGRHVASAEGVVSTANAPADPRAGGRAIGRPMRSRSSPALASGRATFVNDIALPRTSYLAVVRSPYPHARIRSIDASAARERPGVLLVLTGENVRDRTHPIPMG